MLHIENTRRNGSKCTSHHDPLCNGSVLERHGFPIQGESKSSWACTFGGPRATQRLQEAACEGWWKLFPGLAVRFFVGCALVNRGRCDLLAALDRNGQFVSIVILTPSSPKPAIGLIAQMVYNHICRSHYSSLLPIEF